MGVSVLNVRNISSLQGVVEKEDLPEYMLGEIPWEGRSVMVIDFAMFTGCREVGAEASLGALIICKVFRFDGNSLIGLAVDGLLETEEVVLEELQSFYMPGVELNPNYVLGSLAVGEGSRHILDINRLPPDRLPGVFSSY